MPAPHFSAGARRSTRYDALWSAQPQPTPPDVVARHRRVANQCEAGPDRPPVGVGRVRRADEVAGALRLGKVGRVWQLRVEGAQVVFLVGLELGQVALVD